MNMKIRRRIQSHALCLRRRPRYRRGLSGATKSLSRILATELDDVAGSDPDYDDFNDGTDGFKPSVASAKRSALLNAPRPPINGDTPAAKRIFDRVEALMKNDEWMQLLNCLGKSHANNGFFRRPMV
ncbi:hypothetical protein PC119_g27184 [Phytophthora cactorum]|nr:hypothetical protein PC119_g27184 [Phytophthora cactorum]